MAYMAIDQNGNTYHDLGRFPRKGLLDRLGAKSARRLYRDTKGGQYEHIGYVVRDRWCTLYRVEPFRKPVK